MNDNKDLPGEPVRPVHSRGSRNANLKDMAVGSGVYPPAPAFIQRACWDCGGKGFDYDRAMVEGHFCTVLANCGTCNGHGFVMEPA